MLGLRIAFFALACWLAGPPALAGATLDDVRARGLLRCGVSEGIPGFSIQDASGRWKGLDVDFCRAVAAAVLGSPEKVRFVPLKASARFPALRAGKIDLLVRNTTWTLMREAALGVQFPAVLFYDGQGFMVPASARVKAPADLANQTVCVEKGTTHEKRLMQYFGARGLKVKALVVDSAVAVAQAYFSGRCAAYTSDASQLAAMRLKAPGGAHAHVILPERISKEPLGPVVLDGDTQWVTLVRWILFGLIRAEEAGFTQDKVKEGIWSRLDQTGQVIVDRRDVLGMALGLSGDWAARTIMAVGNYGEMYERNVGKASGLGIDRGLNRLWLHGGLMYAPPFE
ncbi:MAG TPA: amino acid ABC transporter substrate-binding protein [Steroidobacteraceae bacterium]|nr:amino acid ABC transporter substrate-binding protein [Steroidobacteraceae bacterium]